MRDNHRRSKSVSQRSRRRSPSLDDKAHSDDESIINNKRIPSSIFELICGFGSPDYSKSIRRSLSPERNGKGRSKSMSRRRRDTRDSDDSDSYSDSSASSSNRNRRATRNTQKYQDGPRDLVEQNMGYFPSPLYDNAMNQAGTILGAPGMMNIPVNNPYSNPIQPMNNPYHMYNTSQPTLGAPYPPMQQPPAVMSSQYPILPSDNGTNIPPYVVGGGADMTDDISGLTRNRNKRSNSVSRPRTVNMTNSTTNEVREEKVPPGDVGLSLKSVPGGLQIHRMSRKSVCQTINVGDIIIALDGVDVTSFTPDVVTHLLNTRSDHPIRSIIFRSADESSKTSSSAGTNRSATPSKAVSVPNLAIGPFTTKYQQLVDSNSPRNMPQKASSERYNWYYE